MSSSTPQARPPALLPCRADRPGIRQKLLGWTASLAAAWMLAGCAAVPQASSLPGDLWMDAAFDPPAERLDLNAVLKPSGAMRDWLAAQPQLKPKASARDAALLRLLQRDGALRLAYDDQRTRTASEAFEARAGNCLSLLLMTAALAQEMGLDVRFQQVNVGANWRRLGGLYVSTLHVNMVLSPGFVGNAGWRPLAGERQLVVDFLPPADLPPEATRPIALNTVLAMFLNNRAAEFMVDGRDDDAYAAVRQALALDAALVPGYNTLGILYSRRHLDQAAARAFERAWALAPDNLSVMANLAAAWRRTGELTRADALARQLERFEPEPPYAYFDRAMLAWRAGRWAEAREHLAREVNRAPDVAEFRYWLAVVMRRQGEDEAWGPPPVLAPGDSMRPHARGLYTAKLERLSSAH